jgi:hypothetical protein
MGQALAAQDMPLYFGLYRIQASAEQWSRDTAGLLEQVAESDRLVADLERHHPQRWRPDIGLHFAVLALRRGADLQPYLLAHAAEVWSPGRRQGFEQMVELARNGGWWELWALLLRCAGTASEFDRELLALVRDQHTAESEIRRRLLLLAGVGSAVEFAARFRLLKETTLVALYERFPDLVRGAFRSQIEPSPGRPLSGLVELAVGRQDDELIDALVAKLAVHVARSGAERLLYTASLAGQYLRGSEASGLPLAERAVSILLRVPASAMRAQAELLRRNALTRLLFERAYAACLDRPQHAAQLLQAANPHVRALAVRALAGEDPRGISLADLHFELMLACLAQPLPRTAARRGIRLLDRITGDTARAQRVTQWARGRLEKSEPDALKEDLAALLGRQLHRYPMLRHPQEQATVYRRAR